MYSASLYCSNVGGCGASFSAEGSPAAVASADCPYCGSPLEEIPWSADACAVCDPLPKEPGAASLIVTGGPRPS
ncbi:MAG: hypothetical protein ACRDLQ_02840 [Solirubrobacterales bacterium]